MNELVDKLRRNLERWRAYYLVARASGQGKLALREIERLGRQLAAAIETIETAGVPRAAREGAWATAVRATARARALLLPRTDQVARALVPESLPDTLPPA
ncbi:MAG TPA: hypothetical protein VG389_22320 [Myxococcota bacterium]|jgi:hypothetical protein|nr:hypothetical protein [Myxococcota bacterium]